MPQILVEPDTDRKGHWIALNAIGEQHYAEWLEVAAPSVTRYAERFGFGLIVFTEHLDVSQFPKHPSWQKLLIGNAFRNIDSEAVGILVLDTDIFANCWTGEDIFERWNSEKIGMVSKRFGMPYSYKDVASRICFLRNRFVNPDYPLDSIWHFTLDQLYQHEGLAPVGDECCAGLFVFSPERHAEFLADIYESHQNTKDSLALEQVQMNYYVQSANFLQRLDYTFHTLWVYEMAEKYPFLYRPEFSENKELIAECIGASLLASTFLHFAGSWNESAMIEEGISFFNGEWAGSLEDFVSYKESVTKGRSRGRITFVPDGASHD